MFDVVGKTRFFVARFNRRVLRGPLLFVSRFSEKHLRLAFFTELLAVFLASLNCFQIEGPFVDAAFFFRKSLLCIFHATAH